MNEKHLGGIKTVGGDTILNTNTYHRVLTTGDNIIYVNIAIKPITEEVCEIYCWGRVRTPSSSTQTISIRFSINDILTYVKNGNVNVSNMSGSLSVGTSIIPIKRVVCAGPFNSSDIVIQFTSENVNNIDFTNANAYIAMNGVVYIDNIFNITPPIIDV